MMNFQANSLPYIFLAGLFLSGCSPANQDLHSWMDEQRREARPMVKPLSEPKRFIPMPYVGAEGEALDPFSRIRLTQAIGSDAKSLGSAAALFQVEKDRRREPLEEFPLDAMAMVGSLEQAGRKVALIQVNGLLYQVRQGNYLGQNFGRIENVAENEVSLREIVQDAAGEWIERKASLQLQENAK